MGFRDAGHVAGGVHYARMIPLAPQLPPKQTAWPPLPGLNPAPRRYQPITGELDSAAFQTLVKRVKDALGSLPPITVSTTRSENEVLHLLEGAERLRTLHDWKSEIENPESPRFEQARMRRYMEVAKGTWHDGTTVYGVALLRHPHQPVGVHDAFGGVALTLGAAAARRATYLATDSMFTGQRPTTSKHLPEVLAERLLRDAGMTGEPEMNGDELPRKDQARLRSIIKDVVADVPTSGERLTRALADPRFGAGFRFVEAQIPRVTLDDVVRIDIGADVPADQRARIIELARAHSKPVGVNA